MLSKTRWGICLLMLLFVASFAQAQSSAPQPVVDALADLNARLGKNLTLNDFNWTWDEKVFQNEALGCNRLDTGNVNTTIGYWVVLKVDGVEYDYRMATTTTPRIFFLCSPYTPPTRTPMPTTIPPTPMNTSTPAPIMPTGTPSNCGTLRSRLIIGQQARVTPGEPNNVRELPGVSAKFVGEIPGEGVFTVLDGPRCTTDGAWWQVDFNGLVGWTLEGKDILYYVEPLSIVQPPSATPQILQQASATFQPTFTPTMALPTFTPTPVVCDAAIPPRLTIGQQARVTPGLPNNLRELPGQSAKYAGEIPALGVFTVLAGPRCTADGAWWQVNYNGIVAWTIEGSEGEYWTEPLTIGGAPINGASAAQLRQLVNWIPASAETLIGLMDSGALYTEDAASIIKWLPADTTQRVDAWSWTNVVTAKSGVPVVASGVTTQNELRVLTCDATNCRVSRPETGESVLPLDAIANPNLVAAFSQDATLLAIRGEASILVIDVDVTSGTFGTARNIATGTEDLRRLVFSADKRWFAAVGMTEVLLWDTANWQQRRFTLSQLTSIYDAQFSLDGSRLAVSALEASVSDGASTLFVWNTGDGSALTPMRAPAGIAYTALAFLSDGTLIAAGGTSTDVPDKVARLVVWNTQTGEMAVIGEESGVYTQLAMNPARTMLVTLNSSTNAVKFWAIH